MQSPTIRLDGGVLTCPNCSNNNLHQYEVITEFRYSEDGLGTRTVSGNNNKTTTESNVTGMAGRRDNIYIKFRCENCKCNPVLYFKQHKGYTFVDWLKH